MRSKQSSHPSRNSKINIQHIDIELANDSFQHELEVDDTVTAASILVETVSGKTEVNVEGGSLEQLSNYKRVKLFAGRIAKNARTISLKISSKVKSVVRVTITTMSNLISKAVDELPCKVCKEVCKLAISAVLAHIGVPYLEVGKIFEMPGISPPDQTLSGPFFPSSSVKDIGADPTTIIPVDFGKPINLESHMNQIDGALGPEGVLSKLVLPNIPQELFLAIRSTLQAVNWIFDATDKIYTGACKIVRCCK